MKPEEIQQLFFEGLPRYHWLDTLGRGGAGVVFKARDLELDEVVAIKVLSSEIERDEEALLARFKRELALNRKVKHPNVARMYDYGITGAFSFITMEFIPGRDLWTIIHEDGRLTPEKVIPILRQICRGVGAIHEQEILHRDLKSQNIIVDAQGAVAILDFGLARGIGTIGFTQQSIILGTPQYMSPEQASGRPVDGRSDLYAIGIIGFEALTGQLPFTGDSPITVAMKQISEPLPDTLTRFPEIPPELTVALHKVLEKEPADRFQTASEFDSCLELLERPAPPAGKAAVLSFPGAAAAGGGGGERPAVKAPAAPPRPRDRETPEVFAPREPGPPSRTPSVLVAGEPSETSTWSAMLTGAGCRAVAARNGQAALEMLMQEPADLVLMDVSMEGLDGFDVTRIIRSLPALRGIPILLTSARADRGQLAFAIQSGAKDLIQRPFEGSVLAAKVWEALRTHGFARGRGNAPAAGR